MGNTAPATAGDSPTSDEDAFESVCLGYDAKTGAEQIRVEECFELQKRGKLFVIDTRKQYEHNFSCIPGAQLLTPSSLGMTLCSTLGTGMRYGNEEVIPTLAAQIPDGATVVCACTAGLRSGYCALDLSARLGRPIKNLHGGIIAWFNAGGEVIAPQTKKKMTQVHTYSEQWSKYVKDGKAHY